MELNPWVLKFCFALLTAAAVLGMARLLRGPSVPDRLVAFDLLALIGVAAMSVDAIRSGMRFYLDIILIWAIVAFLSTVAFAKYLEKKVPS